MLVAISDDVSLLAFPLLPWKEDPTPSHRPGKASLCSLYCYQSPLLRHPLVETSFARLAQFWVIVHFMHHSLFALSLLICSYLFSYAFSYIWLLLLFYVLFFFFFHFVSLFPFFPSDNKDWVVESTSAFRFFYPNIWYGLCRMYY